MGGREGVVDVAVGERRELLGEGVVVGFLLGMEAQVLEEEDLARAEAGRARAHLWPHAVGCERNRALEERLETVGHGTEREFRRRLALRPPEM